jgi:hypothetical protein
MPADPFAAQMASEEPIQDSTGFGSQNGQASYNFS